MGSPTFRPRDTAKARTLRNAATPAERTLWAALSNRQVAGRRFNRQMPVGPYFADFLCRSDKLIVEVDGHSHDVDPDRDVLRDRYLRAQGYRVLHVSNVDVREHLEGVIAQITGMLGPLPTPDPSRKREGSGSL